jgi:LmbE family N-acetylglucosaminyl deacetylase
MTKAAMAVAAHPDDIDLMMGGTLILLKEAGYEIHYMTVANGSCGTATLSREDIIIKRTEEARTAAESIGAIYHPPYVDDIEIFYEDRLIRKLCSVVRQVNPKILLLPSPHDYMEDHMNASRLMVTAAFCRNMKNYISDPPTAPVDSEMCLYHALPWGLTDQLRNPITPDFFVNISSVLDKKRQMLSCHQSQKQWLDESQGMDNYLTTMVEMSARVGHMSETFTYAEGWRRHSHLGFGPEEFDPLNEALSEHTVEFNR